MFDHPAVQHGARPCPDPAKTIVRCRHRLPRCVCAFRGVHPDKLSMANKGWATHSIPTPIWRRYSFPVETIFSPRERQLKSGIVLAVRIERVAWRRGGFSGPAGSRFQQMADRALLVFCLGPYHSILHASDRSITRTRKVGDHMVSHF